MKMSKTLLAGVAVVAVTAALVIGASAIEMPAGPMGPHAPANYGFFVAQQPANGNRVGVFIARRAQGVATLYYCSTPSDPSANGTSGCKELSGFPDK